ARVAAEAKRRVIQVEGDVVVPVDLVSTMRETGARTLRPKLSRLREDFLHPLASEQPGMSADRLDIRSDVDLSDIPALVAQLRIDRSVAPVSAFRGGETEARRRLRAFIAHRLDHYAAARAHLGEPQVSTLSPYLHFGQISPVEIALAVREAKTDANDRASYLDELVIRRELST